MRHVTRHDALLSTYGRLVEAHSRLARSLGRSLETQAGVPLAWFEVLLRVSRADGGQVSMGSLAEQVALTSGGTSRLVDRMVEAGLVTRVPCPTDRRVWFVALTPAGEDALRRASGVHGEDLARAFAGLSAADLRTLDRLLDHLRAGRPAGAAPVGAAR